MRNTKPSQRKRNYLRTELTLLTVFSQDSLYHPITQCPYKNGVSANHPYIPSTRCLRRGALSATSLVMPARGELKSFCFHSCYSRTVGKLFILSREPRCHVLMRIIGREAQRGWNRTRKLERGTTFVTVTACRSVCAGDATALPDISKDISQKRRLWARDYRLRQGNLPHLPPPPGDPLSPRVRCLNCNILCGLR